MKLDPCGNNVIVEPEYLKETASGLQIPESAARTMTAKIVAIGPGEWEAGGHWVRPGTYCQGEGAIDLRLKVGDRVLLAKAAREFIVDGEKVYMSPGKEIIAIVRG